MFENAAVALIVIVLVAVLAFAVGYFSGKSQAAPAARHSFNDVPEDVAAELDSQRNEIAALRAEVAQREAQVAGLQEQLQFAKEQLTQVQHMANAERQQRADSDRLAAAEREKQLREQGKVLEALAPVQKNLDALQRKVMQIEEGRRQEMGALGEQLKVLGEQQLKLDKETTLLSTSLRDNRVRGAWGEAQLRNIIESAGLIEHVDFDTQDVVSDETDQRRRPDMIVHLPGGKTIPIDAKAPFSDYQRACAIPDTASPQELAIRKQLLAQHAKAVRDRVKELGSKKYWELYDNAPDFVIAFIPNEGALRAAVETDPTLMDDAFAQKVALASPTTLWAVLKSVAFAWQQQSLTDEAKELFDLSRELYERIGTLGGLATKLGKSIMSTVNAYNKFVGSLESRVLVTARRLQVLDQSSVIPEAPLIPPEKADVRELTSPEMTVDDDELA